MNGRKNVTAIAATFAALLLSNFAFSQMVITGQDLLNQIGTSQVILEDKRFSIPVDVGMAGESQVWDLRGTEIQDSLFAVSDFISPNDVTTTSFPEASFVQHIHDPSMPGFDIFNFYTIDQGLFINIGDSMYTSVGMDTAILSFQTDTIAGFPITYDKTWMTYESDTTGFYPTFANISIDTTTNHIDGWGTLRLPIGDFQCLRLRQDVKVINKTVLNGAVFSGDTETFIQYNWLSKDYFMLANVQSQTGETNPEFTDAQGFGILHGFQVVGPTSVAEDMSITAREFSLEQNYPNPFNPTTTIGYHLGEPGDVNLSIFNVSGQLVRTVVQSHHSAGQYAVQWDGRNDFGQFMSSGIYMYRLQAGERIESKKLMFMK